MPTCSLLWLTWVVDSVWDDGCLAPLRFKEWSWSALVKPELHTELLWEFKLKFPPWEIWLICLSPCTQWELLSTLYSRLCEMCPTGSWPGGVEGKPKGCPGVGKASRCGRRWSGAIFIAPIGWGTVGTTGREGESREISSLPPWKGLGRRIWCPECGVWFKLSCSVEHEVFWDAAIRGWSNRTNLYK